MPAEGRSKKRLEELVKAAAQLGTMELEHFVTHVLALRAHRLAPSLTKDEERLLSQINQGLSPADQQRYDELSSKLSAETISPEEHQELLALIERVEHADTERVRALTSLAQLREVSVDALMSDLGIHAPAYG